MSSTNPAHVYAVKSRKTGALFLACVCLIASETPSFPSDTVRKPVSLQREGITLGGGDGSSFEKAIIVHAPDEVRAIVAEHEYILLRYRLLQLISQVRLRENPGDRSWLTIERPGCDREYFEIPEHAVADVVEQFLAIDGDVEKFKTFVNAADQRDQY